jgi:hypothetical protein
MEHIPDMDEIASQYDNEQYDQFSRQIPVGGRVVKRPGRRLPMSTTRMKYLQRKNKSLSQDTSLQGSMMSLNEANEQDTSKVKPLNRIILLIVIVQVCFNTFQPTYRTDAF